MEKRALIAVVLSLLILILYQEWVTHFYGSTPPPPKIEEKAEKTVLPAQKLQPRLEETKPTVALQPPAAKEIRVETDNYVAVFTPLGARLKSFALKNYRTSADGKSPPFEMVSSAPGVPLPLGVQLGGVNAFNDESLFYSFQGGPLKLTGNSQGSLLFQAKIPGGATLTKEFSFTGSSYAIRMAVSVGATDDSGSPGVILTSESAHPGLTKDAVFEGLLALVGNKMIREHGDALAKGKELSGAVTWAGFGRTYFLFAALPEGEGEQKIAVRQSGPAVILDISSQIASPTSAYTIFIGPKELDVLKSMNKGLEQSIDFGYFGFVSVPLLYVMHFSHRLTRSYGLDIMLLTILIKLILAPLTHKSFVSMKQMQKLQPQMERLKEKFKDDKEKLNKEIMELYRRNKVNPFGGCFPMLLQFPVFIGLYNALRTPIELRHAPFLWIKDLSRPDWESLPVELAGWHVGIPILTLLMGGSMFLQQWMTPSAGDPNQKRMMLMMPVVFTMMFINFPSGLTIYWLVNNVLSIAQQYLTNRMQR